MFPLCQRSMEAQKRRGFQDDGGTDQPARAHEERARTGDHAISEAEVGGTAPGAIENQQLLLDEYGLGHQGTRAARPASRATVAKRWRSRTARSRIAQS